MLLVGCYILRTFVSISVSFFLWRAEFLEIKIFFKSIWNDAGIRHVPDAFCKQIKAAVCREDSSLLVFAAFHGDDI